MTYQRTKNSSIDEVDDEDCASFLMKLKYSALSGKDLASATEGTPVLSSMCSDHKSTSMEVVPVTPSPSITIRDFGTNSNRHTATNMNAMCSLETPKASSLEFVTSNCWSCDRNDDSDDPYCESDYDHFSLFAGLSVPLSLPDDKYWLSDVQCFIRERCTEVFSATEFDVTSPKKSGRTRPIDVGQVGIRCVFCRDVPYSHRASQAVSFPSQIGGIYSAVVMMQCRHFAACRRIPDHVRDTIANLKQNRTVLPLSPSFNSAQPNTPPVAYGGGSSGRQQYWVESAKKMGLVDTLRGIRFRQDPRSHTQDFQDDDDAESRNEQSSSSKNNMSSKRKRPSVSRCVSNETSAALASSSRFSSSLNPDVDNDSSQLVVPEDERLIPDYLFLAMAQMMPCRLTEQDRVGCYKGREIGFPGMACKHCGGLPGFGKYFPATVRSLAQTTTSQTILKHVGAKCKRCPPEVRAEVLRMQERANTAAKNAKPKYGSRKVFFQRLWGRLHGEEIPDIDHLQDDDDSERQRGKSQEVKNTVAAREEGEDDEVSGFSSDESSSCGTTRDGVSDGSDGYNTCSGDEEDEDSRTYSSHKKSRIVHQ